MRSTNSSTSPRWKSRSSASSPRRSRRRRDKPVPLPLAGVRVMVTRAADHARELIDLLEGRGATVEVVPLIHMGPPPHERALQEAIDAADDFSWIVFTSVSGVESFARRRKRALGVNPHVAAIGPATSEAVANLLGRPAHVVPPRYIAEAIAQALIEAASPGSSVLLVQAQDARPVLAHRLELAPSKLRGRLIACIGPITEAEARRAGLHVELTPERSTVDGLVEALCRYYED